MTDVWLIKSCTLENGSTLKGPQGNTLRVANMARCVRDIDEENH